jgi:hypothetical protein
MCREIIEELCRELLGEIQFEKNGKKTKWKGGKVCIEPLGEVHRDFPKVCGEPLNPFSHGGFCVSHLTAVDHMRHP